jgi:hypothetical protein
MKKKNNFLDKSISFEDFEQAIANRPSAINTIDELVHDRLSDEKESRKKEQELKKAHRENKK